ncbi:acyltransferase [Methylobacterium mesophilicum SR1.6/6]|uniref:Acyltransferase n=1 Tax=Methylobacterium mesophilicum SR1.6/6 TaxID=908290 RepID=A0A6B9FTG7_9HYPH|nr:acyltransferase [Methylobacterium mesophilicum]QGY05717.1 acyltransferase [Methylobacterium mesophilicum SR1.6/6]
MIYNLQVLRALASYGVFLTHFGPYAAPILPRPDLFAFGATGVDVFFVLSGFIMFVSTSGRGETAGRFLLRRAARVVPVYWLVTVGLALIAMTGLKPIGIMEFRAEYLLQSLLFVPFSRGGYIEPLVSVGWTLNYEMFFYAAFAGLLLVPMLAQRALAAGALFAGLMLLGLLPGPGFYWAFYTKPIVVEFAAGIGLGYVYLRLGAPNPDFPVRRVAVAAFAAAGLLILGGQVVADACGYGPEMTGFMRPLVWGTAATLIVGAMLLLERGGVLVRSRWLLAQGNASYSFYLVHNLLLHTAAKVVSPILAPGLPRVTLIFLLAFVASAAIGDMLYRHVEVPLSAALRRRFDRQPASRPVAEAATS